MKKILPFAAFCLLSALTVRATDAQENWDKNCASCHGKDGKGATKAGRMAGVKDLTDPAYQKDIKDEKALAAIKDGIKDEKGKEKMKAFAEKLTPEEMKALVAHVRSFVK
ncbi:MAG TPA: cytochrome c [Lacunisphaera sp.]